MEWRAATPEECICEIGPSGYIRITFKSTSKRITVSSETRKNNRDKVLAVLLKNGDISRERLGDETRVRGVTMDILMNELISEGIVTALKIQKTTKPVTMYSVTRKFITETVPDVPEVTIK